MSSTSRRTGAREHNRAQDIHKLLHEIHSSSTSRMSSPRGNNRQVQVSTRRAPKPASLHIDPTTSSKYTRPTKPTPPTAKGFAGRALAVTRGLPMTDIEYLTMDNRKLRDECYRHKMKERALSAKLQANLEHLGAAGRDLIASRQENALLIEKLEDAQRQIDRLRSEKDKQCDALNASEATQSGWQRECDKMKNENNVLKSKVVEIHEAALRMEKEKNQEIDTLNKVAKNASDRINAMMNDSKQRQLLSMESSRLQSEARGLRCQYEEARKQVRRLRDEVERKIKESESHKELATENERKMKKTQRVSESLQLNHDTMMNLHQQMQKDWQSEKEGLKADITRLRADNDEMRKVLGAKSNPTSANATPPDKWGDNLRMNNPFKPTGAYSSAWNMEAGSDVFGEMSRANQAQAAQMIINANRNMSQFVGMQYVQKPDVAKSQISELVHGRSATKGQESDDDDRKKEITSHFQRKLDLIARSMSNSNSVEISK